MNRRATTLAGLVVLNGALLVAGVWRAPRAAQGLVQRDDGPKLRIGLVFDVGGLGDKSFNDAAYLGLEKASRELNLDVRTIQPADGSDRESGLRQLAADGYDLVIGVGFVFTDDMRKLAGEFPKVKFACIDYAIVPGAPPPPPNLVALKFREEEGSYLVGALAALVSTSKKVGFVGGMQIPLIKKFEAGYTAGVKAVCPSCEVYVAYAGTEPKAFADPTMGKELALSQYDRGADVVFHASGKTGAGVFAAAEERGKLAIGVDADQFHEAPCCVLSSMVKDVDLSVLDTVRAVADGRFRGGVHEMGLAENGVDYIYDEHNKKWITDDIRAQVEALRPRIIDGEIKVPKE
jgi:basic membrane protein A